ncbi:hypothetical protein KFK09_017914 [Dendrobium nobile]|uniref:Reverse transcriptase zinc-binding domain-containing protein n=1 Tax=Dendrobium nobile TaxID=94219 RepID=A0A8T3ASV0_DENNO|nr:hypothetical protein KFK09_017914 [Dendrobium nobile]
MALKGGLKTVDNILYRNIQIQGTSCYLCHGCSETTSHFLFECNYSFMVLTRLIPYFQIFYLRPTIFQALDHIGGLSVADNIKKGMLLILNAIIYFLWNECNIRCFNSNVVFVVTLTKKISRAIYLKVYRWKNGDFLKDILNLKHK